MDHWIFAQIRTTLKVVLFRNEVSGGFLRFDLNHLRRWGTCARARWSPYLKSCQVANTFPLYEQKNLPFPPFFYTSLSSTTPLFTFYTPSLSILLFTGVKFSQLSKFQPSGFSSCCMSCLPVLPPQFLRFYPPFQSFLIFIF